MVYFILFVMGISLAFLDNLSRNLLSVFHIALAILLCNLLERALPWQHRHRQEALQSRLRMALDSLTLCGVVVAGFLAGLTQLPFLRHATAASEYALMLLLFLIGLQLRGSGMTLRQILFNRRGMLVSAVVLLSALLGLPLKTGLALASGFGWYSLSCILMTEAFGPVIGSAAFFNDLLRELLAIMLIPALIALHHSSALGLCGATAMDFTLPVPQRAGGSEIVPATIVHGFIMSLLAPLLIAFFAA
ncbi:membrane protein|nr:membrane protein [Candidatus Pantoea persica]